MCLFSTNMETVQAEKEEIILGKFRIAQLKITWLLKGAFFRGAAFKRMDWRDVDLYFFFLFMHDCVWVLLCSDISILYVLRLLCLYLVRFHNLTIRMTGSPIQ